jgi:hypothetical protein
MRDNSPKSVVVQFDDASDDTRSLGVYSRHGTRPRAQEPEVLQNKIHSFQFTTQYARIRYLLCTVYSLQGQDSTLQYRDEGHIGTWRKIFS